MLVVRLFVGITLVVVCALVGVYKSRKFETREHILREAIYLFRGLENEIRFSLNTLPNAIEIIRQRMNTHLKDVLGSISLMLIKSNIDNSEMSGELDRLDSLTSYDKQIILTGITSLGSSDIDGEQGIINMTISSLESELDEAIESKKKNSKMYKTVGLATGLVIAIILI
ncbi:MAG: stage III sporulation protein AB [Clostridia bacterium]|nr:stage III sporulation protein AB [Clostridia bacterium]